MSTFKPGDKVYCPLYGSEIFVLEKSFLSDYDVVLFSKHRGNVAFTNDGKYFEACGVPILFHATVENYELLCKLFPGVNWDHPEPRRKGSNLCRDLLAQGKNVLCYVSDTSDEDAVDRKRAALIINYDDGHTCPFRDHHTGWTFAVPIDIDTLEPIEEDNINE